MRPWRVLITVSPSAEQKEREKIPEENAKVSPPPPLYFHSDLPPRFDQRTPPPIADSGMGGYEAVSVVVLVCESG